MSAAYIMMRLASASEFVKMRFTEEILQRMNVEEASWLLDRLIQAESRAGA